MNRGQSRRIGKLLLSDRQLVHRASVQRLRIEAISELAKEMRDAATGIPLPNVHDPFPEDRRFHQGCDQNRPPDFGMPSNQRLDGFARNVGDDAASEHLYAMVSLFVEQVLKIECLARYVDR